MATKDEGPGRENADEAEDQTTAEASSDASPAEAAVPAGAVDATPDVEQVLAENERLKQELEASKAARRSGALGRARRILVGVLVVLSCVMVIVSVVAWWTHETLLNTDRFVAVMGAVAEEPAVQEAVAVHTTDAIFSALEIQTRVQDALPDRAQILAAPITNAVYDFTLTRMRTFTASQTFQDLWVKSLTVAHQGFTRVIRNEAPNVAVVNGEVRLNLLPFVAQGLQSVGQGAADLFGLDVNVPLPDLSVSEDPGVLRQKLAQRLGVTLPEDFGTVTLMSEDQLSAMQSAVRFFDRVVYLLAILTVVFLVLAVVLSWNRRRTLIELGIGLAVAVFIARIATRRLEAALIDSVSDPTGRSAAKAAVPVALQSLRGLAVWLVVISIIVAIVAYLVGRPRWLMNLIAWVERNVRHDEGGSALERAVHAHFDLLRIAALVVGALVLFVWGIGWLSVLVMGVLVALAEWGLWALNARAVRAQALIEEAGGLEGIEAATTSGEASADVPQLPTGAPSA